MNDSSRLHVLILTRLKNDASLSARFLRGADVEATPCDGIEELASQASLGCGALMIAEECLNKETLPYFNKLLQSQPSWSDLPIIVITTRGDNTVDRRRSLADLGVEGNVMLIERPFSPRTLISVVDMALRSRKRQYQVRGLLESSLSQQEHLEFVLEAGDLGNWRIDLATGEMVCSATCKANFGVLPEEPLTYEDLSLMVDPRDRELWSGKVQRAVEDGTEFQVEYRIVTRAGEMRWIHAKGRVGHGNGNGNGNGGTYLSGITQNITQRKEAERELEEQTVILREADRRKDEFVAMLAHELRNPLASVANASLLLKEDEDAKERAWAMEVIERQSQQLTRLVDDLLDVSRITQGKIELRRELLDGVWCLENAYNAVAPLVVERRHTLIKDLEQPLWLEADPARLEQIVGNLLANAAKYTDPGGTISLTARNVNTMQGPVVEIAVRDNGMGISPERIPRMFELFAQGERTYARSDGGLGIGLTLVRKLCEMHGGSVSAQSEGHDKGSTFIVRLPAAKSKGDDTCGDKIKTEVESKGQGLRVLVVDDNMDTARSLGKLLMRRGYVVDLCFDGSAALEKAAAFLPHVMLLDIGLPNVDGYEVTRRLRRTAHGQKMIIVALSGYGQAEDMEHSRAAGFDHHLVKPVNFEKLLALLQSVAAKQDEMVIVRRSPVNA